MQTDLVYTYTGMGATNSTTGQGHSDHSNSEYHPLVHRGNGVRGLLRLAQVLQLCLSR